MKNNTFLKNKKIGIAVSGGVDSMVLQELFSNIRKQNNLELYTIHYNHKWRKDSFKDANLVRNYCKKNNIHFAYGEATGKIVKNEEVAREQRYLFFKKCAEKYDLGIICTAHHFDDQIETILYRLCRGTGPRGLLPIKEYLNLQEKTVFYRPFLDLTKKEIYTFARSKKIPYREDISNKDLKYKRNLIRNKIIPLLLKVNKDSVRNIFSCSDQVYAQNKVLENYFLDLLNNLSVISKLSWDRKKFLKLDEYTQKAFIYWFLSTYGFKGSVKKSDVYLDAILNQKKFDVDKEFWFCVNEKHISFQRKNTKSRFKSKKKPALIIKPYNKKEFIRKFPPDKEQIAYVDLSGYKDKNLSLRYRGAHDVFQPLGFSSGVKLKKYLINKKIPRDERYDLPLLCFKNEVLWIPGYSLSEKIKVLDKPTHILEVRGKR